MKLYIPTTTLNFNNILSSETISPKAFYGERGYGYKRWENVVENNLENCILLYNKPFSFTRPNNGLDDYPMLVEIDVEDDELNEFEKCGEWGYKSSHSLVLTPVTTRFIFFSKEHKSITLSKSGMSAETKLARFYKDRLCVETYQENADKYDVTDFEKPDHESLENDKRQNKIKGFAYGYTIGRILSRTEDGVMKLRARYNVRDMVASILSNSTGKVSQEQVQMLVNELLMYDNYYVSLLKKYGKNRADEDFLLLEQPSSGYNSNRNKFLSYLLGRLANSKKWEGLQNWIVDDITKIEKERVDDNSIFKDDGQPEFVVAHGKLSVININVENVEEYKILVNDVFTSDEYDGNISTFRMKLADEVTDKVCAAYGDKWKDSEIRTYLNAMRRHVAGGNFTQSWDNVILSSITAVILKGDSWNGLFRFMVLNGMTDYRYAFGIYGALNGFANLTRGFTDILFASENKQYTWKVYREIHRQLYGKELEILKLTEKQGVSADVIESKVGRDDVKENFGLQFAGVKKVFMDAGKKDIKGKDERILRQAIEEYGYDINKIAESLSTVDGWKKVSKKVLKDGETIVSKISEKHRKSAKIEEPSIPFKEEMPGCLFCYDDTAFKRIISPLLKDEKERVQVETDTLWFQDNYHKNYKDRNTGKDENGRYYENPKDNINVIKHFSMYLKKKSRQDWIQKKYAHINIEEIISELKKTYLK